MNTWAFILATALVLIHFIEVIADRLNLQTLNRPLPKSFQGIYDEAAYAKLQHYTTDQTQFGILESFFHLIVLLGFWFGGGFDLLDQWVRGFGWGVISTGLAYFSILWIARWILGIPFDLFHTFVLEERYGFNRSTFSLFLADTVKSLFLTAILGLPLAAGVLALFQFGGDMAWLYGWMLVSGVMLLLTFIGPRVILPLFYKFEPLPEGDLRNAIMEYSQQNNFSVSEISVMDGSRRSAKSNAFFTGFGRGKRIVLFDTLIEQQTVPELVAVLAHEVGHYRKRHIIKRLGMTLLTTGAVLWLAGQMLHWQELYTMFKLGHPSLYAGLVVFFIFLKPFAWLAGIVSAEFSRRDEYEADAFAKKTTGSGKPLIRALQKLSKDNLSHLEPHPLTVILHHSHPPVLERIKALR